MITYPTTLPISAVAIEPLKLLENEHSHLMDASLKFLAARKDVTVLPLVRAVKDSCVLSAKNIYDTSWHTNKGIADWVVIANIDELLFHPDMLSYLYHMHQSGVTAIPAFGFQMIDISPPATHNLSTPTSTNVSMQFQISNILDAIYVPN